jgi:predicted DNA-binding transcriptional regulator YafY
VDTTTPTRQHLARRVLASVEQLDELDRHLQEHHDDAAVIERDLLADAVLDDLAALRRLVAS